MKTDDLIDLFSIDPATGRDKNNLDAQEDEDIEEAKSPLQKLEENKREKVNGKLNLTHVYSYF
jgi:hypothetical protein